MIGCVVNGLPVSFAPRALSPTKALFDFGAVRLRNGETHVTVFLTKPIADARLAVAVFISFDESKMEYAGFVSNARPSRVFKVAAPAPVAAGRGELMDEEEDQPEETHVLRVGCDLEPAEELESRKEAHDAAKRDREFWARQVLLEANRLPEQSTDSFLRFASYCARDCADYLGSFAKGCLVDMRAVAAWHDKLLQRLRTDPLFWARKAKD